MLASELEELHRRTGRPHWLVIDEAHHLLPATEEDVRPPLAVPSSMLLTVHPRLVSRAVLEQVDALFAFGEGVDETVRDFCRAVGRPAPRLEQPPAGGRLEAGEAVAWCLRPDGGEPFRFRTARSTVEKRRHRRKYAQGDLGPSSFVFTGPEGRLRLRAQNLAIFLQLAEGLD